MDEELFNSKTVKRFSSKTKLSRKQKAAAQNWLDLLKEGKLKKEKSNYLKFARYILEDILGYDITEIKFEEDRIEFSVTDDAGDSVLGIEVKGTNTKDLFKDQNRRKESQKTPIVQLWNYMGNLNLKYGIATNYKHFVLIDKSQGISTYHLFDFEEIEGNTEKLKEFVAIFSKEQIVENQFVETLKEKSAIEERNFTKEFYKIFHETRLMLIKEFQNNEDVIKEGAVHFAQMFLNRLMFIFFAEDTGKIPERVFERRIIAALNSGLIADHSKTVSDTVVTLFESLDKGATVPDKIFGFNGGLFRERVPTSKIYFRDIRTKNFFKEVYQYSNLKKDIELDPDSEKIFSQYEDKLNPIIKNLLRMASFDFNTEVSVNILGHVFEQSISDLEELREGKATKRKKEGVYYTPEYITDYICRNTIIPYLSKDGAETPRDLVLEYSKNISVLEEKFKNLKILDPACGSGAFLIKAVEVLLEIHKEIQIFKEDKGDYLAVKRGRKYKKQKTQFTLAKWKEEDEARNIIKDSIYGVDLNEDSVDITKLSIFFKIAKKNRKLMNLSKNIKCGNSLIDDKSICENAFNWEKEFPFKFDIVIGNPPYLQKKSFTKREKKHIINKTPKLKSNLNLATVFMHKALDLLKDEGYHSFIVPKSLTFSKSWAINRRMLIDNLLKVIDCSKAWEEVLLEQVIYVLRKNSNLTHYRAFKFSEVKLVPLAKINKKLSKELEVLLSNVTKKELKILNKIKGNSIELGKITNTHSGLPYQSKLKKAGSYPAIGGGEIGRYLLKGLKGYFDEDSFKNFTKKIEPFKQPKIVTQDIVAHITRPKDHIKLMSYLDSDSLIPVNTLNCTTCLDERYSLEYILALLNSKFISWYAYRFIYNKAIRTMHAYKYFMSKLLIPSNPKKIGELKEKVKKILSLKKAFLKTRSKFLRRVCSLGVEKPHKKLREFHKYSFEKFVKELKRKKVKISLKQQDEWEDYFNDYKKKLTKLSKKIASTDAEIDDKVYKLYGLTKEEIEIVENE